MTSVMNDLSVVLGVGVGSLHQKCVGVIREKAIRLGEKLHQLPSSVPACQALGDQQ